MPEDIPPLDPSDRVDVQKTPDGKLMGGATVLDSGAAQNQVQGQAQPPRTDNLSSPQKGSAEKTNGKARTEKTDDKKKKKDEPGKKKTAAKGKSQCQGKKKKKKRQRYTGTTENFVSNMEGGQKKKAYPPPSKDSGVTIATGVDLAKSKDWLKQFPQTLQDKLSPVIGLKGDAARKALNKLGKQGIEITKDEADLLDKTAKESARNTLINRYNNAIAKGATKFEDLPQETQKVMESLEYNYGTIPGGVASDAKKYAKSGRYKIWDEMVKQDWYKVHDHLRDFKEPLEGLKNRRNKEADLLERVLAGPWKQEPGQDPK